MLKMYKDIIDFINKNGLYPDIHIIEGVSTEPEIIIKGERYLQFCSNNYLGIATDKRIKIVLIEAIKKYGMGSGGSRLISGNLDIQVELEREIARYKKQRDAICFLAGYMANIGAIPPLVNLLDIKNGKFIEEGTAIFSDELNHASIIDGCRLTKTERIIYRHKDMGDLESKLQKSQAKIKLVVTDGVFSMDGDITPLDKIAELCKRYHAIVMVDDAHGSGILGENGRGTPEYFHIEDKIPIVMGTFTKTFGGIGGFIASDKDTIEYLRITARSYIFSAPIAPPIAAGLIEAIKIVEKEPQRRRTLLDNISYLKSNLNKIGFNTLGSETQIIPIFIGKEEKAIQFSRKLFKNNIFLPCVRWPAVENGKARLRITLTSLHIKQQLDYLLDNIKKIGKELKVI